VDMRRFCRPHDAIAGMRCLRAERDNAAAAADAPRSGVTRGMRRQTGEC
jgi:hypothetical protein